MATTATADPITPRSALWSVIERSGPLLWTTAWAP
jgi:hypothetical protein